MRTLGDFFKYVLAIGAALLLWAPLDGAQANRFRVLHSFADDGHQPFLPRGGLIADGAGNLYGASEYGGEAITANCVGGCGTVFELTGGEAIVLHSFTGGSDGAVPLAGLAADATGNLYGATYAGGTGTCDGGCGIVFKVAPDGTETVLHSFQSGSDGARSIAGLIVDEAGNVYGTSLYGGGTAGTYCPEGCGTVFKVAPDGTETILHAFAGYPSDGAESESGLLADEAGNFYGMTVVGGAYEGGTIFKLTPDGTETVLHSFRKRDGKNPVGSLIADEAGNLYGTAQNGGTGRACDGGCGTVFKLAPDGTFTVLHSFRGGNRDGSVPYSGLLADEAGNLYGTTVLGGRSDFGVVFKLAPDGTQSVLHSFAGGQSDGQYGDTNLILDQRGYLYGTTAQGGTNDLGIVYKVQE